MHDLRLNSAVVSMLFAWVFILGIPELSAQCESGESEIAVVIVPANWPNVISWELLYDGEVFGSGTSQGYTICFDSSIETPCLQFSIHDSYGDGIYAPGGYWLYQDGVEIATGY